MVNSNLPASHRPVIFALQIANRETSKMESCDWPKDRLREKPND
jgi:hypothetical protein